MEFYSKRLHCSLFNLRFLNTKLTTTTGSSMHSKYFIYYMFISDCVVQGFQCAVPENIHTHPTEGIGFPGGQGVLKDQKNENSKYNYGV